MSLKEKIDRIQAPDRLLQQQANADRDFLRKTEERARKERIARNKAEYSRQQEEIRLLIKETNLVAILRQLTMLTKGRIVDNNWSYINIEGHEVVKAHKHILIQWDGRFHGKSDRLTYGIRIYVHEADITVEGNNTEVLTKPDVLDQNFLENAFANAATNPGDYSRGPARPASR